MLVRTHRKPTSKPRNVRAEPIWPPQESEIALARGVIREPIAKLQHRAWVLVHGPPQQIALLESGA